MAKSNAGAVVLAPFSVTAGSNKGAPAKSTGVINIQPNYGTGITIAIQNGASPPSSPLIAQVQVSYDGVTWRDFGPPIVGDTSAYSSSTLAGLVTAAIDVPKHYMYAQVIAYGNLTNPVSLAVETQACTVQ